MRAVAVVYPDTNEVLLAELTADGSRIFKIAAGFVLVNTEKIKVHPAVCKFIVSSDTEERVRRLMSEHLQDCLKATEPK